MNTKRKGTAVAKKGEADKVVVTSIRLDTDTHERFKVYAAAQRRSLSNQLRVLIDEAVAAHDQEKAA